MIKLKRIQINGFLSIEEYEHFFDDYDEPTLVLGVNCDSSDAKSNGSGKSAFISESLTWCLFGRTLRPISNKDIIKEGCRCAVVQTDLEIGESVYTISRYQNHPKYKNGVVFKRNGEPLDIGKKKDTQAYIEGLIGFDFDLFCQSTIIGQDSKTFLLSSDAERKRILDVVVGLNKYEVFLNNAKNKVSLLSGELSTVENNILRLNASIDITKNNIINLESRSNDCETNHKNKLADLNNRLDKVQQELSQIESEYMEIEKYLGGFSQEDLGKYDSVLQSYNKMKESLQAAQIKIQEKNRTIDALKRKRDSVRGVCPTCNRPFENQVEINASKDAITKECEDIQKEVVALSEDVDFYNAKIEVAQNLLVEAKKIKDEHSELMSEFSRLEYRSKLLSQQKENINNEIKESNNVAINPFVQQIEDENIKLKKLLDEGVSLDIKKKELEQDVEYYSFWVTGFGKKGIQSLLLDGVTNYLTERANYYSSMLTNKEIEIYFNTQRELSNGRFAEDLVVECVNRHGAKSLFGSSVGERQKVSFIISLTLRDLVLSRTGNCFDFFVCDEASSNIDEQGNERMFRVLKAEAARGFKVFYVTHDVKAQNMFNNVLVAKKENGNTTISKGLLAC